jgi:Uncharacterised MFS-type transporter YbfB
MADRSDDIMQPDRSVASAFGGLAAIAAAIGIGRFVYTPILPSMMPPYPNQPTQISLPKSASVAEIQPIR